MAEIEQVLAVEGAVDRAVLAKEADLDVVKAMLVPYRDGALGWFEAFENWVRERTDTPPDEPVLPTLEEALGSMADERPRGRDGALRLLALTVLARAVREFSPQGDRAEELQDALGPLTPNGDTEEAIGLHELIVDVDLYPAIEQWGEMVTRAGQSGVLATTFALQTTAPCTAKWRAVQVGGQSVAATQLTSAELFPSLTVADIEEFLDPSHWPTCHPFWCSMDPVQPPVPGHRLYKEVVSLNCGYASMSITTILEFVTVPTPATGTTGARVDIQYWLWPPPPMPPTTPPQGDGEIIVDEGFISAWDTPQGLRMKTLKLVAFRPPFPSAYLAMIMCPLGYAAQGEHMVYSCAVPASQGDGTVVGGQLTIDGTPGPDLFERLRRRRDPEVVTVLHGPESGGLTPIGGDGDSGAETSSSAQPQTASTAAGSAAAASAVAKAMADALCGCGQDAAKAYDAYYQKVQAGTYTSGDVMADSMSWWARVVRDVGTVAGAARRSRRRVPRVPDPRPYPDPHPDPDPGATS
jgi:hypothetical protein